MYENFGQFINGKWQKSISGDTYEVINPATEEVIGKASKANKEDIQLAIIVIICKAFIECKILENPNL